MKIRSFLGLIAGILFTSHFGCAQAPRGDAHCLDPEFDDKVRRTIQLSVPVIDVDELRQNQAEVLIFDAREQEEFAVSHIPGARYLGYKDYDPSRLADIDRDQPIVLYCSIGYRSEKIARKLEELGFTQVQNLYGSIFEWMNRGYPVVDKDGRPTRKVHTYNRNWSQWVDSKKAEKVW